MEKEKKYIIKMTEKEIAIIVDMFGIAESECCIYENEWDLYKKFEEVLKIIKEKNKKTIDII